MLSLSAAKARAAKILAVANTKSLVFIPSPLPPLTRELLSFSYERHAFGKATHEMTRQAMVCVAAISALLLLGAGSSHATPPKPIGNLGSLMTSDDYPTSALRMGAEGTTGVRLDIDAEGQVRSCTITRTSGNDALDEATCALFRGRARFTPATDQQGKVIASSYSSRVIWQIPDDGGAAMSRSHFQSCLANDGSVIQVETPFGCAH